MRSTLALTLITVALLAWQAAGNVAAQVPPTPTAAPAPTATPIPEKERLELAKLRAEVDRLDSWVDRYLVPVVPVAPGVLAFIGASAAAILAWRRLNQDRDKYRADRQADAERREDEQFRFIVEQFSGGDAARLAAAVNIQTFFREERLDRFRRQAVEILIGNLRVEQTEPVRKALMVALREGIFSLPPYDERLDLRGCNLRGAEWQPKGAGNEARGIPLNGALLSGEDTNLQGAQLQGAQLQRAILGEAQLQGAALILRGAQLQEAWLKGAQLQGAILWGAQLQGAILEEAQLQGAMLEGAQLQEAWLKGAVFGPFPVAGVERQTDFSEAALDDVCIASLEGTNWKDAIWNPADRKRLEARYGAPGKVETAAEPAAETPGGPEA